MMYEEVITTLSNGIQNIDILIANHIDSNKSTQEELTDDLTNKLDNMVIDKDNNVILEATTDSSKLITWEKDQILTKSVINIKESSKLISNNCIKLALLIKAKPTNDVLQSLIHEQHQFITNFIQCYFEFLKTSYSYCLFDDISRLIRTMLVHNKDILIIIQSSNSSTINESINYQTGMILKIKEEIDKLPLDNKQSYRRLFMQQCLYIKETVQEFKEYLNEAKEKSLNPNIQEKQNDDQYDNDGDDNDDDENEELDYTEVELKVVEKCLKVMSKSLGCIKQSLNIITIVNDQIHQLYETNMLKNSNNTIFNHTIINTASTNDLSNIDHIQYIYSYSSKWVHKLAFLSKQLNQNVLNLGSELYPPFEKDLELIQELYQLLKINCMKYIELICNDLFLKYYNIEYYQKMIQFLNDLKSYDDNII